MRQALREEQSRSATLSSDIAAARHEVEQKVELLQQTVATASREKAASDQVTRELHAALELQIAKAGHAAGDAADAQREVIVQASLARKAVDEAARAERERNSAVSELREAMKQQEERTAQARVISEQAALRKEREATEKLRTELAAVRREGEAREAALRSLTGEATRLKDVNSRAAEDYERTSKQAKDRADKLAGELSAARQQVEVQTAAARDALDEAQRTAEASKGAIDAKNREVRESHEKAEKLAAELATLRAEATVHANVEREAGEAIRRAAAVSKQKAEEQAQSLRKYQQEMEGLRLKLAAVQADLDLRTSSANAARDEIADLKAAHGRIESEHRRLLQERDEKTEKLASALAESRSRLKSREADELARESLLAAVTAELQDAKEATSPARQLLADERTRARQLQQEAPIIQQDVQKPPSGSHLSARAAGPEQPATPVSSALKPANPATKPQLDRSSLVRLVARGHALFDQGNIGAARNMFDQAAQMGSGEAMFRLAETYDPDVLSTRHFYGTQSDAAKARELYARALAAGVAEAKARLETAPLRAAGQDERSRQAEGAR